MTCHSSILNLKTKIPQHSYRCVAVAEEKMDKPISDYKQITDGDETYDIVEFFRFYRFDPFPEGLLMLATGQELTKEIWDFYPKSLFIAVFIIRGNDA